MLLSWGKINKQTRKDRNKQINKSLNKNVAPRKLSITFLLNLKQYKVICFVKTLLYYKNNFPNSNNFSPLQSLLPKDHIYTQTHTYHISTNITPLSRLSWPTLVFNSSLLHCSFFLSSYFFLLFFSVFLCSSVLLLVHQLPPHRVLILLYTRLTSYKLLKKTLYVLVVH